MTYSHAAHTQHTRTHTAHAAHTQHTRTHTAHAAHTQHTRTHTAHLVFMVPAIAVRTSVWCVCGVCVV